MTIAVDLGRKATKQTNKQTQPIFVLSIFEWPFKTGFTVLYKSMFTQYVIYSNNYARPEVLFSH